MFHMMLKTQALPLVVILVPTLIVRVSESCNLVTGYYFALLMGPKEAELLLGITYLIPPPNNWHSSHQSTNVLKFVKQSVLWVWHIIKQIVLTTNLFQIQIYSSDTREWKISIKTFSVPSHVFQQGVYWNGAVYWVTKYHKYLYFKLDVEKLQMQPLPMRSRGRLHLIATYFGDSRGCLHLIPYHNHQHYRLPLNVYEMFSDHSSWFVKYQVVLNAIPGAFPDTISRYAFSYDFKVIDVVRGEEEEEEDTFMVLKIRENIIKYNVHDKSFKHIYSLPRPSCFHENSFHRYTETLSSF
ncbi:hypothetical protein Hdeb2414_s0008g00270631 [Helianthus debilis subsp. tardiflorus]